MNMLKLAMQVLQDEENAIAIGRRNLDDNFVKAVDLILSRVPPGRVVVIGIGKSGHIGKKIAATLSSTGTPSLFVHPAEAGHGDLGVITGSDIVLAISQSGASNEILTMLPYIKRNGIPLVVMTGNKESVLAINANHVISTFVPREACPLGLAPTASTTLALAIGDAIAMCLLDAKGITKEIFASTHPHGSLGRRLMLTVEDIMITGAQIPVVYKGAMIKDCLVKMSASGMGFINIQDSNERLVGIFTDGDLRRILDREIDLKITPIENVMTTSFVTIEKNKLAVEAVELMERNKILALPIVDLNQVLIGALNMRILLKSGVI